MRGVMGHRREGVVKLLLLTPNAENVEVRCDRCRHWRTVEDARLKWTGTVCVLAEKVGSKAVASGGDYPEPCLITEPDFGCVLFEPTETP